MSTRKTIWPLILTGIALLLTLSTALVAPFFYYWLSFNPIIGEPDYSWTFLCMVEGMLVSFGCAFGSVGLASHLWTTWSRHGS